MKVMPPAQAPLGASGRGRPESRFGEGLSALPSLVLGTKFLGWMARRPRSCHDPADSGWSAGHGAVGKFRSDAAVAVASAMASEDGFNEVAHLRVGALGRGRHRGGSPARPPPCYGLCQVGRVRLLFGVVGGGGWAVGFPRQRPSAARSRFPPSPRGGERRGFGGGAP